MKIAIVGSRGFVVNQKHYNIVKSFIAEKINITHIEEIVSGGAEGADSLALWFAKYEEIERLTIFCPQWKKCKGKSAGYVRNQGIVAISDVVFVFWDGKSKGTKHTIDLCEKMGTRCCICEYLKEGTNERKGKRTPVIQ